MIFGGENGSLMEWRCFMREGAGVWWLGCDVIVDMWQFVLFRKWSSLVVVVVVVVVVVYAPGLLSAWKRASAEVSSIYKRYTITHV
jgi:phage-related holin